MNGSRLKKITVSGSRLGNNLEASCVGASLSLSNSQVTEMSLQFLDSPDLDLFSSNMFRNGASLRYDTWQLACNGVKLTSGKAGPVVTVTAPSRFVLALRKQTGAKSWGDTNVSAWVQSVAASVGMSHHVQPGLGTKTIARKKPETGQKPESTWDVLTQMAKETGVWLFEYGTTLVFAKPSYMVRAPWPRKTWSLVWNQWGDYSSGMTGMPDYTNDPDADYPETLTVKLVSADADTAKPGDTLILRGRHVGPMGGTWIIKGVEMPLKAAQPVVVTAQRPLDPKIEKKKTSTSTTPGKLDNPVPTASGAEGSVDVWVQNVNGRAIDIDGAYGAQCVDLANHFHLYCVGAGTRVMGNGNQWFDAAPANLYNKLGPSATAAKGDIACWNGYYGVIDGVSYGHVAIVLDDLGSSLKVMTQNPGGAHVDTLSKQGIQGYLRPKRFSSSTPARATGGPVKVV
jgi:surface antigen